MSLWRHMVTGADNRTADPARVITVVTGVVWLAGALMFLFLMALDYMQTRQFNPKDFAYSFATLVTSGGGIVTLGGAGIALKANTEPKPGDSP